MMKKKLSSPFTPKLLALVLPIAFQQFMSALVSASDALMLGALSQDALSAVSLASQVTFVENLFLAAMTIGLSMFASQYWGKRDILSMENIFAYTMRVTVSVSAVFSLAGFWIPHGLMRLFTNVLLNILSEPSNTIWALGSFCFAVSKKQSGNCH